MTRATFRSQFGRRRFVLLQYLEGGSNYADFPVWLASQDADKFLTTGTNETNFAELAECGIHFTSHTLTDAQQLMILGGIIHTKFKKAEAALRLQGKLITGATR